MKIVRYKGRRGQVVEWTIYEDDGHRFLYTWESERISDIIVIAKMMNWKIDYNSLPVGTIITGVPSSSEA